MTELEKVIKGLECCITDGPDCPNDCPYIGDCNRKQLHTDALVLLKKHEPLAPVQDGNGALICGNQTLGCGVVGMYDVETGKVTEKIDNYCAFCGRKVKWE